ncbi:MAG: hypothetical protein JWN23_616 [Rhodocyclales bacterium]|nr:hypothetical protein [Rhodocyclales bacterium]
MQRLMLVGLLVLWAAPGIGEKITTKNTALGDYLQSVIKSQGIWVKNGFFTGNDYRELNDADRGIYLMGIIDGFLFAPTFGAPQNGPIRRIERCVTSMRNNQVTALVDGFLLTRPVQWHEDMHVLTYQALLASCPK